MAMRNDEGNGTTSSASLQIRLLGTPQIRLHGAPVDGLTSTKAQGLLFYLLVTGRVHTRPALAGLLWGRVPEASARASLRKALQQLREYLGAYLDIQRETVAVAKDADLWVDVVEFDAVLQGTPISEAPARVRRAVDLYRDDFLEGFYVHGAPDFEDWWLSERSRLRALLSESLHDLATYYADQGQLETAIHLIRRCIAIEPWREEAHRHLMTWLARTGQRGAALAQYESCCQVLEEELGVEPAEETTALYERIRGGDLEPATTMRARRVAIKPQRPTFLDEDAEVPEVPREPFVAREPQLARLSGFLEAALAGRGQAAFLRGEAGWGKTSLLDAFARQAQNRHPDLIVASGTCSPYARRGDPYLPFQAILRMLCADVERQWAAGAVERGHALRLWRFLPHALAGLASQGPHLVDAFIPGEPLLRRAAAHDGVEPRLLNQVRDLVGCREDLGVDQEHIFDEWTALLRALSAHRPLLLMLDDLHWADRSSIGLLFHLGRRLTECPILIAGAYRPEEVSIGRDGMEHPLVGVLNEFKRRLGDVWVDLGPGDPGEARRFIDALLDSEPNRLREGFRQRLAHETQGHPLCAIEMVREMKEQGHLYQDREGRWMESPSVSWHAIPTRVEGVIEARMRRLEPDLRRMLTTAAMEGEAFTAEVVSRVQNLDERRVIGGLSGELARRHYLVQARGIREVGDRRISRYHFSHNLFQTYLYHSLDPVERSYLHEAVGRALETLYEGQIDEVAVHLARHFEEAGSFPKAIGYLRRAGDAAARVQAVAEAAYHYQRAIVLAEQIDMQGEDLTALQARLKQVLEQE